MRDYMSIKRLGVFVGGGCFFFFGGFCGTPLNVNFDVFGTDFLGGFSLNFESVVDLGVLNFGAHTRCPLVFYRRPDRDPIVCA